MSAFYPLLQVNTLRALVGNLLIFVRIRIRILPVVQSADPHVRILPVAVCIGRPVCIGLSVMCTDKI